MGATTQRLIEEADREAQEREDKQRCPDCGNVREECGTDPADMWLVCGHCAEEEEAAEEERQIAASEDAEPDFDPEDA
jgi:hypothetical protein